MASNYTKNYQLNQWEPEDKVVRTDFNEDNEKIDAALNSKADKTTVAALQTQVDAVPRIVIGTYKGDNAASRKISLGFTPKAVYAANSMGVTFVTGVGTVVGGLAVTGSPVANGSQVGLEIVSGGFRVHYDVDSSHAIMSNYKEYTYHYIAIG